jgi:hypothetical protein
MHIVKQNLSRVKGALSDKVNEDFSRDDLRIDLDKIREILEKNGIVLEKGENFTNNVDFARFINNISRKKYEYYQELESVDD